MSAPVLVSACLVGFPCRHDGRDRRDEALLQRLAGRDIVPVCPEVAGGLGVPRLPATLTLEGRVLDQSGADVTAQFAAGALAAVEAAVHWQCESAILKANSPSCGTSQTNVAWSRVPGRGVAAAALASAGVGVSDETGSFQHHSVDPG